MPALDVGEHQSAQESGDIVSAAVPAWQRRHGHPGILGQHRNDGVDVVSLPGRHISLDELAA
jgi:hypothetical protein